MKIFRFILNYVPGIAILLFSMVALHATTVMIEGHPNFHHGEYHDHVSMATILYWSVIAVGLAGFVLLLLNGHKIIQLKRAQDIQKQDEQERIALQKQVHQAQKMEAIGRLAGGIAHDFNNILAAINGYAEFLRDDLDDDTPQYKFAVNILNAGQQATTLVDQMLTFSRRNNKEFDAIDLSVPVNDSLGMLRASIPRTIDLVADIDKDIPKIRGNTTQISQVLMNLCVNAMDAMEDGRGQLLVSLKVMEAGEIGHVFDIKSPNLPMENELPEVRIQDMPHGRTKLFLNSVADDREYIYLTVKDNGTGISRETIERMFDPFFTTKAVDKGTGLGLSTVHGIISSHQAAMLVDTKEGAGTTFALFFPILKDYEEQVHDMSVVSSGHEHGPVLVVEDDDVVRHMIMTMLDRSGFEAEETCDGQEALAVLTENPGYFRAVITDQNMPKMTGLELIEQAEEKFPDLPFIVVSGFSKKKLHDLKVGHPSIKAILRKPVPKQVLCDELTQILSEV